MKPATLHALEALNRRFYSDHAGEFSATRRAPWPGWSRVLAAAPSTVPLRVLDIGCGNGRFARFLLGHAARPIDYLGLDASRPLLRDCPAPDPRSPSRLRFEHRDVLNHPLAPPPGDARFDLATLFGLLHHVPSFAARASLLRRAAALLAPGGRVALTFWRFAEHPRLQRRIVPRHELSALPDSAAGALDPDDLEPGDHLLRWGGDPARYRYCHHASAAEQNALLAAAALHPLERFDADGAGGRMNHYVIAGSG